MNINTRIEQLKVSPGNPFKNTEKIISKVEAAKKDGIELIVFSEMVVPGYLLGDEWERLSFIRECQECGNRICEASENIIVIFGNVGVDWDKQNEDGRVRKYNALFIAENKEFINHPVTDYPFVIKTLLPNYREFDDSRHFFDLRKFALENSQTLAELVVPIKTSVGYLGCVLCEDAWDSDYAVSPLKLLANQTPAPDLFINISCSPFTANKNQKRSRVFSKHAHDLKKPFIYVNNTGIQDNGKTIFTFDGESCVYDTHGHTIECGAPFEESSLTIDLPTDDQATFGTPVSLEHDGIDMLYKAIHYGAKEFLKVCYGTRITIGASGGIDSALSAAIYSEIVGPENLLLVNMPSRYNSKTTISLAKQLAENLGCYYTEIPIEDSVNVTSTQIDNLKISSLDGKLNETLQLSDFMKENVQARDRSSRILAAASNAFGSLFTCNANKTEFTVGYSTLYGDVCGFLATLADLWKLEVYEMSEYMNKEVFGREVIPQGSIDLVPSAELNSKQNVDEGKGDPLVYPYHDKLFKSWVEWWDRATPEEALEWYIDGTLADKIDYPGNINKLFKNPKEFIDDLERWWKLYQGMGLTKRIQAPPVIAVKRRAFGFDKRESQLGVRFSQKYLRMKEEIIGEKQ
jgi:NAD+ synthase (glutamine-hydrolysing)